jgi:hypothetical protein
MPRERPRYALVVWPDNYIGCIPLWQVDEDVEKRGAIVIGREDSACMPGQDIEPSQSSPRIGDGDEA